MSTVSQELSPERKKYTGSGPSTGQSFAYIPQGRFPQMRPLSRAAGAESGPGKRQIRSSGPSKGQSLQEQSSGPSSAMIVDHVDGLAVTRPCKKEIYRLWPKQRPELGKYPFSTNSNHMQTRKPRRKLFLKVRTSFLAFWY